MGNQKFYIGNYKKDAKRKGGWFIGYFMGNEPRRTENFEVKYWEFPPGKTDHEKKIQFTATEFTVILRGRIDGVIDGERIKLEAGEYVVIPPQIENGFPDNVFEYVEGLTIKIPSKENDKKVIK